jgi:hypothetical protein
MHVYHYIIFLHLLSFLKLTHPPKFLKKYYVIIHAMPYYSLCMTLDYFKSIFIIKNEMQELGYHFCQISQNVTPVLKLIILSI